MTPGQYTSFTPLVFCSTCKEEGLRSKVYPGMSKRTLMAVHQWYDEDGNLHVDDRNKTTTSYSCSNGHKWSAQR